jgi:hypothetical protein
VFVRFRETARGLQLSVVETRRIDGKVRHEHVVSLGSIETPLTVAARIAFWRRLHERLARLSNRIDVEKMLAAIHARIPMVTPDEQRSLQLENAKADAALFSGLHEMHAASIEDHKRLAATVASTIAKGEAVAAEAAANAKAAQERVEQIKRGENVEGGLHEPHTREDFEALLIKAGFTREDIRHYLMVAELSEEEFKGLVPETLKRMEQAERAAVRAALRRRRMSADEDGVWWHLESRPRSFKAALPLRRRARLQPVGGRAWEGVLDKYVRARIYG